MKVHHLPKDTSHERLIALRQELAAFRTLSCRMVHEKATGVIKDPFSGDTDYEGLTVLRRGLCPKEVRRKTLGCAHTPANEMYARLLAELGHMTGIAKEVSPWAKLTDIVVSIYKLDHEKGNLEKHLAVLSREKDTDQAQKQILARLSEVTEAHMQAVAELETIRQNVLQTVDKLLSLPN